MTEQACQLQASVTEEENIEHNSRSKLENEECLDDMKQDGEEDNTNPFSENDVEELFENIPELKEIFHVKSKIGEGTFSNVYLAHVIDAPEEFFAIKYIIPTSSPERVEREVRCLQEMGGVHNVVGYKGTLRNKDHSAIVLPYFPHDRFQNYFQDMTIQDICDYMKNLFEALQHIHSFSIIHRDVKPGNFLHSRTTKRYNLVDFGLAMHEPGSDKAWDIEKKKNETKNGSKKNVRLLSPESCKSGQATKKPRTSPRFTLPSHKLTRQAPTIGTKLSSKSSLKNGHVLLANGHRQDVGKSTSQDSTKLAHKSTTISTQQRVVSLGNKNTTGGLCATNHRRIEVCSLCMKRSTQNAPRAGTSGFRAPEVLMKFPKQTTALDIWSAGVIMLCLLSGRYPFFRCYDDMTALAQIISLFGKQRVMENSKSVGKYIVTNTTSTGFELKSVCQKLRLVSNQETKGNSPSCCKKCTKIIKKQEKHQDEKSPKSRNSHSRLASVSGNASNDPTKAKVRFLSTGHTSPSEIQDERKAGNSEQEHLDGTRCVCFCGSCSQCVPKSAYELLERCLDLNPETRITANQALSHPFFTVAPLIPER